MPTRNTTVPAANRKPKNRTSKRMIEASVLALRAKNTGAFLKLVDSAGPRGVFYSAVAVAKLGLRPASYLFDSDCPAVARRLAKNASMACATDPTVRDRQLSETRCSRSSLLET